jgi:hypothetical protein
MSAATSETSKTVEKTCETNETIAELLKQVRRVTTLHERPGPVRWDCMCRGNCSMYSPDVYKLWNTYHAIVDGNTDRTEMIKRLNGALAYYLETGTIPWHVTRHTSHVMHFDTRTIKQVGT